MPDSTSKACFRYYIASLAFFCRSAISATSRAHELKIKDIDRLARAAKNLQMGINPMTAKGYRRLHAEYDRLVNEG